MKPLKISIRVSIPIQDGYLYAGNLFVVFKDGTLRTIPINNIIQKRFGSDDEKFNFFNLAFLRNNWFSNDQSKSFFAIPNFEKALSKNWMQNRDDAGIIIDLSENDFSVLHELPTLPIFDIRLFGMRLFVGNRDGLYDSGISVDSNTGKVSSRDSLERVFDGRTTYLNSKTDTLLISSNSEGLFHGNLPEINRRLHVGNNAIRPKSLRTGWSQHNVVNYESQSHFNLLSVEQEHLQERTYMYSSFDEDSKKIKITEIGHNSSDMFDALASHTNLIDNIRFAFNAPKSCYFLLNNGKFVNIFFNKYKENFRLSPRIKDVLQEDSNLLPKSKIISANIIRDGCVLEYEDRVILVQNGQETILEKFPVYSVRTYPTSIRYKNIVSIVDRYGISLYSVYPFK